ncbi:MAG: sugar phosphate isomerase/epimerase [Candidatus Omnitrophica bacterium]|nr:sugar phosphate isomerase/epimerase [Candidatus Omnitrophota bacterium]
MKQTRRTALKLLTAFALSSGLTLSMDSSAIEQIQGGMKISCSSLAFSDMDWKQALREIRARGFLYADLAMFEGWTHVDPSKLENPHQHGDEIRRVCEEIGISPIALHANFNPMRENGFPGLTTFDEKARVGIVQHFTRTADCAQSAQIPLVNIQPGRFIDDRSKQACLLNAIRLLRRLQSIADERKLILTFENHAGSIAEQPEDALQLLEGVKGLRLDYDPSHVVSKQIPLEKTMPLLKYIAHIGIRNATPDNYNQPIKNKTMDYDIGAFLNAFRTAKVNAYISVEYYTPEMRPHIDALKEILIQQGVPLK